MKIVFLAPFGIRPKGTLIARMIPLAAEFQDIGHQVVIVAPPYTNPEDTGKTELVNGVVIRNIKLGPEHKVLAAPLLAWRMFSTAFSEKPDIVHLFKPKGYGGLAAMLHIILQRLGLRLSPLLLDTDDWEGYGGMNELHSYSGVEKSFYAFQEQWLLKRAFAVTVASRALESMVAGIGVSQNRIFYLPNCITERVPNAHPYVLREHLGIKKDSPVVLLYTRFFEFSQDKLYFLFTEIARALPEVRFLVVGKGRNNEEERLFNFAREEGFADALVMAGWVEPDKLADCLSVGDVAIYPFADTLVNRTKCPAKLTELLLLERAVVADAVGQISEYIKSDVSGVLCSPDNWTEMAQRTVELLKNPLQRDKLGSAGRRYLLENFRWSKFAENLLLLYKNILK
ncbi:MAG: glycosyltransferase family 4 protein [Desulfuromonadaceae bacterium]|nr:glycosyltransferase family 4 protein [Desulfuromonadaceae bacterium]